MDNHKTIIPYAGNSVFNFGNIRFQVFHGQAIQAFAMDKYSTTLPCLNYFLETCTK